MAEVAEEVEIEEAIVRIVSMSGEVLCSPSLLLDKTVGFLKTIIEKETGIEWLNQRLLDNAGTIDDGLTIREALGTEPDDVTLVRRDATHAYALAKLQDGNSLAALPFWQRNDRSLVLEAIRNDPFDLLLVDKTLLGDIAFMLLAVEVNGSLLEYADENVRADREVVMAA